MNATVARWPLSLRWSVGRVNLELSGVALHLKQLRCVPLGQMD
jgi:hypothetical protein